MVSQGIGGHEGFSGTPIWKIREQYAAYREQAMQESLAYVAERSKPIVSPNVLVDAVCLGGASSLKQPLVRHVIVKDLRKVADRMKVEFPETGLFAKKSPMGLFALFDGQSGAGEPGPAAAEFCAKNFHKKIMENLAALPPNCTSETFVKAAVLKSFEELDKEMIDTQPAIQDGCGASVALLVGDVLFTAVLGHCGGLLQEVGSAARPLGKNQGRCHLPEERTRLGRAGATMVGVGAIAQVVGPQGLTSSVTRSLGDIAWKQTLNGLTVLSCIPEIQSIKLSWAEKHTFLLLQSKPVAEAFSDSELVAIASDFPAQPRAACGEICTQAIERTPAQCTAVEVWFLPGGPTGGAEDSVGSDNNPDGPAKKKAKTSGSNDINSARLRHILLKVQDPQKEKPADGKKALRTRIEGETVLRRLAKQLRAELEQLRKSNKGRKPEEIALKSVLFLKLCKEHSECPSSQKGGGMCGDLGWISKEQQVKYGGTFRDLVAPLKPGDFSDIVFSNEGLHLLQRIA